MELKFNRKIFQQFTGTPKKDTFSLAFVSIFMVIVMITVAIRPAVVSVINQISTNKERRILIEKQVEKINHLRTLIDKKNEYSNEIDLFDTFFPNEDKVEFLIHNIYQYSKENSGINIVGVSTNYDTNNLGSFNTIELSVNFECEVSEYIDFLKFLESFPRIINVKNLMLISNPNLESDFPFTGSLSLEANFKNINT